ncbi:hypothetical protein ACLQ2R_17435 [Streptosporangium sp. DT93]|uniref:hypothetical protein n=1 Tax=Streptosporangium sp. DT93 TaxID=3393428 RepID=UPI003CF5003B
MPTEPEPRLTAAQAAGQLGIRPTDRDAFMLLVARMQTPAAQEAELRRLRAELDAVNRVLREAGFEYPLGAPGVQDLAAAYKGALAARDEAVNGDG